MAPDSPGWYRDPRRPGMRRYWDGYAWVDVDRVIDPVIDPAGDDQLDEHAPEPPAQRRTALPRLVAQRRPDSDDSETPRD